MTIPLVLVLVFTLSWIPVLKAEDTAKPQVKVPKGEEAPAPVIDIKKLRNPFVSQLPVTEEKIKRPVEPSKPKDDNGRNRLPAPLLNKPPAAAVEVPKPVAPKIVIQGLMWGGDKPQAIVGNTVVGIGDKVQDMKIVAITKEGIEVLFLGQKLKFKME